jgi:hypothetical protein
MARAARPVRFAWLIALLAVAACATDDRDSSGPYPGDSLYPSSSYDRPYDFRYGTQLRYGDDYCTYHQCRATYWP